MEQPLPRSCGLPYPEYFPLHSQHQYPLRYILHSAEAESQYLEALTAGTLDMGMIAVEFYCNSIPQLGAMLLPYMYEDYDQVTNVLMSEAGDYANEQILEVADCVNLSYFIQAFRQIYSTREIKSADDLKGVKIRVPESSLYVDTFEMMGAAPTPLPLRAWRGC